MRRSIRLNRARWLDKIPTLPKKAEGVGYKQEDCEWIRAENASDGERS